MGDLTTTKDRVMSYLPLKAEFVSSLERHGYERQAPIFRGNGQQCCAEFMSLLLDALQADGGACRPTSNTVWQTS